MQQYLQGFFYPGGKATTVNCTCSAITLESGDTVMLVEVPDAMAVEWTRPDDFPADTKEPAKKLLGLRAGGFLTAFADGATVLISKDISPKVLQLLLGRNDGEPLPVETRKLRQFVPPATE